VDAPSGGQIGFESLRQALVGEDPLERERLWQKMYRYLAYYGRQGAGMHMISGADIALWDIAGKAFGQPVCKLLGAQYHKRVKAYASTLFRPTPDAMKQAVAELLQLVGGVSTDDRPTGKTPARAGTAPIVAVASPVANGNGHHAQSARHAGNGAHTRRAEIPLEDNFKDF